VRALTSNTQGRALPPFDALLLESSGIRKSPFLLFRPSPCHPRHSSIFAANRSLDIPIPPRLVAATICMVHRLSVWAHHMFITIVDDFLRQQLFWCLRPCYARSLPAFNIFIARHDVGRKDPVKTPMNLLQSDSAPSFLIAVAYRHMCRTPFDWQPATPTLFVALSTTGSWAGSFRLFGARFLLLVSENHVKATERSPAQTPFLALSRSVFFQPTFDSMPFPACLGMPRRIYTYEPGRVLGIWNLIETLAFSSRASRTLIFC